MSATPTTQRSAETHGIIPGSVDVSEQTAAYYLGTTVVVRTVFRHEIEQKFRRLADQWREETEHLSSITKASMHPAYQRIIGMGHDAIPLLLRELQDDPDHWFWALNAITEQDPAQSEDTFDGAVRAWLRWGKANGYL